MAMTIRYSRPVVFLFKNTKIQILKLEIAHFGKKLRKNKI